MLFGYSQNTIIIGISFLIFFVGTFLYRIKNYQRGTSSFLWSSKDDSSLVDKYSLCHLGTGFFYIFIGRILGLQGDALLFMTLFGSTLWESMENNHYIIKYFLKKDYPSYNGDTPVNSISDIFMAYLSYLISEKFFPSSEGYFWTFLFLFLGIDLCSQILFSDSSFFRFIFPRKNKNSS